MVDVNDDIVHDGATPTLGSLRSDFGIDVGDGLSSCKAMPSKALPSINDPPPKVTLPKVTINKPFP